MIKIKHIEDKDYYGAMKIKVLCWTEELAGKAENTLIIDDEITKWKKWMYEANLYNDKRITLCAFEEDKIIGVAAASFADEIVATLGIELNGLWIDKNYRGKKISLMLMKNIIKCFDEDNISKIFAYNCHHSESNTYYRKLGFKVVRQELQKVNNIQLLVDLFMCDFDILKNSLNLL